MKSSECPHTNTYYYKLSKNEITCNIKKYNDTTIPIDNSFYQTIHNY